MRDPSTYKLIQYNTSKKDAKPLAADVCVGELPVNYNVDSPMIMTKDTSGNIRHVPFVGLNGKFNKDVIPDINEGVYMPLEGSDEVSKFVISNGVSLSDPSIKNLYKSQIGTITTDIMPFPPGEEFIGKEELFFSDGNNGIFESVAASNNGEVSRTTQIVQGEGQKNGVELYLGSTKDSTVLSAAVRDNQKRMGSSLLMTTSDGIALSTDNEVLITARENILFYIGDEGKEKIFTLPSSEGGTKLDPHILSTQNWVNSQGFKKTDTNYYPTNFTWTKGTTAGPTGSLTGTGMSAVTFPAIPVASTSQSGVVTTSSQTFAGTKTINLGASSTATTQATSDNSTKIATTAFVKSLIGTLDGALVYKGPVNSNADIPANHTKGWTYIVNTAGTYVGEVCEVGDMIVCLTSGTTANNAHWNVIQTNVNGVVTGPASSINGQVALFNGTTGKILKNTGNASINGTLSVSGGLKTQLISDPSNRQIVFAPDGSLNKSIMFESGGNSLRPHGNNKTAFLGSSINPWANAYITTIHGALDGNAKTATNVAWDGVTGKPTIPSKTSDLTNDSGFITNSELLGYLQLPGVNTSNGSFRSTDSALQFTGDRSIAVLFTTPDHSLNAENAYIFTDASYRDGRSVYIRGLSLFVGYGFNTVNLATVSTSTTYLIVISEHDQIVSAYLNELNPTVIHPDTYTAPTGLKIGRGSTISTRYPGVIHSCRLFNYALSADEVTTLWNNGNPAGYVLPTSGNLRTGCVAEYLPGNITTSQWIDSAGSDLNLTSIDTPERVNYNIYPTYFTGNLAGNATSADKLSTPRTISLGTGVTSTATNFDGTANITIPVTGIKEAYLEWGGKNFTGDCGPIDAALVPELGANRFAYLKSDGITIEYSRDGGKTWTDYGAQDIDKTDLFSPVGNNFYVGKATSGAEITSNYQLRVLIDTKLASVYTILHKFAIYISEGGSTSTVTIEKALQSTPTTFINIADNIPISGEPGWNIINVQKFITYSTSETSQYGRIRFTFKTEKQDNPSAKGLCIKKIQAYGGYGWEAPSELAKSGHVYKCLSDQAVEFPGNVRVKGDIRVKKITGDGNSNNSMVFDSDNGIHPLTNNSGALGSSNYRWNVIYSTNVYATNAYATTFTGNLAGNATTATSATNLASAPSLSASGNNITVTAGGKTSSAFTVPYATSAGSVAWANVSGKPSSFTPSTHTHAYTQLTGSTTTANQAIVSSGTANGWTLKTLGSNAFNSTVIPTKVSQLTNDSGFITNSSLSGYLPLTGGTLTGTLTGTTIAVNTLKAVNNAQIMLSADGTAAKAFTVDNASSFRPSSTNTTSSLGSSTYKWKNAYIETVHGSLDGNATTATTASKTTGTLTFTGGATGTFNGSKNVEINIPSGGTGTVKSVAMTVPTGLSVSGTPITTSGTFAITYASGYSIPTTAKQSNWDTAFGWGNHASAGYTKNTGTVTSVTLTQGEGITVSDSGTAIKTSGERTISLNTATNTAKGGFKPWMSHTAASTYNGGSSAPAANATVVNVNAVSTTTGKYYAIETDNNGRAFVNVPWEKGTGTVTSVTLTQGTGITISSSGTAITTSGTRTISLNKATSTTLGGVMIGYTENGKNYPVELDSSGKAFVNVPWTDTNDNYYPTTFTWTNGTTAGPTGRLTGFLPTAVTFPAIPSATASVSGVVTTSTQTFAGAKTFNNTVSSTLFRGPIENTRVPNTVSQGTKLWVGTQDQYEAIGTKDPSTLYVTDGEISADEQIPEAVKTTTGSGGSINMKFWTGTQSQYNSISSKDANTIYIITE